MSILPANTAFQSDFSFMDEDLESFSFFNDMSLPGDSLDYDALQKPNSFLQYPSPLSDMSVSPVNTYYVSPVSNYDSSPTSSSTSSMPQTPPSLGPEFVYQEPAPPRNDTEDILALLMETTRSPILQTSLPSYLSSNIPSQSQRLPGDEQSQLYLPQTPQASLPLQDHNEALSSDTSVTSPKPLRKQCESRLSLPELYIRMGLGHNHDEARIREQRVLGILRAEGFKLGERTWIRDTTEYERKRIINKIYTLTYDEYKYSRELIEVIVRRGSYYLMQGRLRRIRRGKQAMLRNSAKAAAAAAAVSKTK